MSAAVATFNKKLNNHAIAKHRRVSVANVVVVVVDGPTRTEGKKSKIVAFGVRGSVQEGGIARAGPLWVPGSGLEGVGW